jgi:UDP:flavonoid glycosyltransferase YjiC (YdhE family)
MPIIEELRRQGAEVLLASDGGALVLLRQAFPRLEWAELPGYQVEYRSENMVWSMAGQAPKILWSIWQEHKVLKKLVDEHAIDGIISDNRFGCFSHKKPSVFITHQINIQLPFGLKSVVNFFNQLIIKQFNECWVPDLAGENNLSGELSHRVSSRSLRKKMRYLGALTRFDAIERPDEEPIYEAIAVLSGPEPQRTRLEKALIAQANSIPGNMLIVQGKPGQQSSLPVLSPKNKLEIVASLPTEALSQALEKAAVFIGRSGYSTIMDLARLRMPALLIPTPGQTEQEYLAAKFMGEGVFFSQKQSELDIKTGMLEAKKMTGLDDRFFDEKAVAAAVSSLLRAC